MIWNLPANAGGVTSIPELGRSPGETKGRLLQYFWEVPWTEEPGRLQSIAKGLQGIGHNLATEQQEGKKKICPRKKATMVPCMT